MLAQKKIEKKEADYLATLKEKEKHLLVAQEEWKEKEQRSLLEALKEKDAKLQLLQKTEEELRRRIQELEHKNALQEKDMKIKELELQKSRKKEKPASQGNQTEPTKSLIRDINKLTIYQDMVFQELIDILTIHQDGVYQELVDINQDGGRVYHFHKS
jgi:hypothetical protein